MGGQTEEEKPIKRICVGLLAHVDAGKTTLSEAMLYRGGSLKKLGRVDHGDAFLDTDAQERARGITIFSKQALLDLPDASLTLLDTPGHVDFSPEMERTLQVLDYAVLVISAPGGIQAHTETLWRLLARRHIPTFLFLNKTDLPGLDRAALLAQLKTRLGGTFVDFTPGQNPEFAEEAALGSEQLLAEYMETGAVTDSALARAVARRGLFPCYFGAALRLAGVDSLLEGLQRFTLRPTPRPDWAAKVFKIARDEQGTRLTYLKVTGGALAVKTMLTGEDDRGQPWEEKVNQLRLYSGAAFRAVPRAETGQIVAVTGLSHTRPGEGLGAEPASAAPLLEPVLTYRVLLPQGCDAHTALQKLHVLEEEDPQLHLAWNEPLQEVQVQLMGEVQLEVLQKRIGEQFGLDVGFGPGNIVYKETIAAPVEGVGHFEPLRHYAEVHLVLEPAPRGSGLHFASVCSEDVLDKNWQRLILTHLEEKTHKGVLAGAPLTDMTITLAAGKAHQKHTEGGDFRQATYRAVRQGLMGAESILLEPWYNFRLQLPAENVGRALSDLQRLCAETDPPETWGDTVLLQGSAPVATLQGYGQELAGYTHGLGRLACTAGGYRPCHNTPQVLAEIGYEPERDLNETADSVFCSHGAGVQVKWNEVPAHMHLPGVLAPPAQAEQEEEERAANQARRAASYRAQMVEDKELLAIFERTYGPLKRDRRTAVRPAPTPPVTKAQPQPAGPEYLLVDGYNILFAWEDLKALAQTDIEAARAELIHMLCNYQGFRPCELILVFDAYKVKGNVGQVETFRNINVVYTKEAETADTYIERVTHQLGRKHRVRVATSDSAEQFIILGNGALRVSARAFRQEVDQVAKEIRTYLES